MRIVVRRLGVMPYRDALALQRALVEDRRAGRIDDTLLLVEHPHVLTLGYDHRVIDGAVADEFMSIVKKSLENWDPNAV